MTTRPCARRSPARPHTRIVVCRGGTDNVLGIVAGHRPARGPAGRPAARRGFARSGAVARAGDGDDDLADRDVPPAGQPARAGDERVRRGARACVTDSDFLGAIVGEIGESGAPAASGIMKREDGSWLVEGGLPIEELQDALDLGALPGQDEHQFTTVAGFVLYRLGPHPAVGGPLRVGRLALRGRRHGRPAGGQGAGQSADQRMNFAHWAFPADRSSRRVS